MARKIARIVTVDAISPIKKADRIEVATVGGWKAVVGKGEFSPGDLGVYFEIDAFLPEGLPVWQRLVDDRAVEFDGRRGHVLKSLTMRGQTSQGYLVPLRSFAGTSLEAHLPRLRTGDDVSELLGVVKYDPPLPADVLAMAIGRTPGLIRGTDQERLQNLNEEFEGWRAGSHWEATEKLEGWSSAFALLDGEFLACSAGLSFRRNEEHPFWRLAAQHDLEAKLRSLGGHDFVLQGEIVGPTFEGNHYLFDTPRFYLYAVYDVAQGRKFLPHERREFAREFDLPAVPVIEEDFVIDASSDMQALLQMADGASRLNPGRRREGLVFKSTTGDASFKTVSNKYLLNEKL